MAFIADRVAQARAGTNPYVIGRLPSGWAVIGDVQVLSGYCLLLGDPVVSSLNDLSLQARGQFLQDMVRIGDAILKVTDSFRINYEILGNSEPELHAHILPRYMSEPEERRRMPAWFYDWQNAVPIRIMATSWKPYVGCCNLRPNTAFATVGRSSLDKADTST